MENLRATVSKVIFSSENTGYKVLLVRNQGGKYQTIVGEFGPEIVPETIADFQGEYSSHTKYGSQLKIKAYTVVHNAEELSSIRLFIDHIAPNIGIERSEAIVDYFGINTVKILTEAPGRLTEVPGIGKVSAESLVQAWRENQDQWENQRVIYSLRAFLTSLGLKERKVKRILLYFGGHEYDAEESIRENPYRLIEVEGLGFTIVDFIARRLGIPESHHERLKAFIIYCLNITCPGNGHLFLTVSEILEYIQQYCTDNNTRFLGTIVTEWDIDRMLKDLVKEEKIIVESEMVYSKRQYFYESESASLLTRVINYKSDLMFLNRESVTEHIKRFEHENNLSLSDEQMQALYLFAEKKVFVITGFPGTGKTLVLKAIVKMIHHMGLNLTCMTPTGISAKKLSSVIDYDAYTIHRRLGYQGNAWVHGENNKFETDVAIIDETSMVDQEVFYRLLSALKPRVHIIFVGDHNQLPSVGAGNVLRELINCSQIPVIHLTKIFRQAEASEIKQAAHDIILGDTSLSLFKSEPKSDIYFMRIKEIPEIERIVMALAAKFKSDKTRIFQIISPRRTGPLGVESLNQTLQQALNPSAPELKEIKFFKFILRRGDRIIVKKNDYDNDIYNGDVGKVTAITAGNIIIQIDGRLISLSVEEIEEKIQLAYATTVHNSQGQEYPTVILLFINQFGKNMLQRNLLYTAITRAKQKVIVIGHGSAIERAINNTSVIKRNTFLGERIKIKMTEPYMEPVEYVDEDDSTDSSDVYGEISTNA